MNSGFKEGENPKGLLSSPGDEVNQLIDKLKLRNPFQARKIEVAENHKFWLDALPYDLRQKLNSKSQGLPPSIKHVAAAFLGFTSLCDEQRRNGDKPIRKLLESKDRSDLNQAAQIVWEYWNKQLSMSRDPEVTLDILSTTAINLAIQKFPEPKSRDESYYQQDN